MFVASIIKISTFNKDVLDREWTLTVVHLGWSAPDHR